MESYTEPDKSGPHHVCIRFSIVLCQYLHLPNGLFPSDFPTTFCVNFSTLPYLPHALPISSSFMWLP